MEKQFRKFRPALFPAMALVVLAVMTFIAFNFFLQRVNVLRADTRNLQSRVQLLSERQDALLSSQSHVRTSITTATLAIPQNNPSVFAVQHLRNLAASRDVTLNSFSISSGFSALEQELRIYRLEFEAGGEYISLAELLTDLASVIPIVNLESAKFDTPSHGGSTLRAVLVTYSAAFPRTLPALDEPLSGLSLGEEETLLVIDNFLKPQLFSTDDSIFVPPAPREDPFSLEI